MYLWIAWKPETEVLVSIDRMKVEGIRTGDQISKTPDKSLESVDGA
jgi:hypothetical protein